MRGKKIDSEFLSKFIEDCIVKNKHSAEDIVAEANNKILEIDNKIKEVENLKKIRSKLLDVVYTFDKKEKSEGKGSEFLPYYSISNHHICKFICNSIKNGSVDIRSIKDNKYKIDDLFFAIKQLSENKIIKKNDDYIVKGENYDKYVKYILKET